MKQKRIQSSRPTDISSHAQSETMPKSQAAVLSDADYGPCLGPNGNRNFYCERQECQIHLRDVIHNICETRFTSIVKGAHNGQMPAYPEVSMDRVGLEALLTPLDCRAKCIVLVASGNGHTLELDNFPSNTKAAVSVGYLRGVLLLNLTEIQFFRAYELGEAKLAIRVMNGSTPVYWGDITEAQPTNGNRTSL